MPTLFVEKDRSLFHTCPPNKWEERSRAVNKPEGNTTVCIYLRAREGAMLVPKQWKYPKRESLDVDR